VAEEIRQGEPADVARLVELINRAFAVTRAFRLGSRTHEDQVRQMMKDGTFLLMMEDDALVACVYLRVTGKRAYLGTLSVEPAQQKRGLGSRMMRVAEEFCRAAGSKAIDIRIVNVRTELPEIYHKWGYVETGTLPADAITDATEPIHFVTMAKEL